MLSQQHTRLIKGLAIAASTALGIGVGTMSMPAWGDVPSPSSSEIVLHFSVQGDRTSGGVRGTIGAPVGVTLDLVSAGAPLTQSWATCVVDAQGDCSFVVPVADITIPGTYTVEVDPSSPDWEVPPVAASSISILAGTHGGETVNASQKLALERVNPPLPDTCGVNGLKIAMVVDLSGSMDGSPLDSLKTAAKSFVNALTETDTQIQLFTFSTTAPADTGSNNNRPITSLKTQSGADTVNGWIDGWTAGGNTNWDAGLAQVALSGQRFDFVVFITDGAPNVTDVATSGNTVNLVAENTASANAIKAMGTRILVFGVNLSGTAEQHIGSVAGTIHDNDDLALNDYFIADWATVAPVLLSITTICAPTTQTVNIQYVDDDNNQALVQPAPGTETTLTGPANSAIGFTEDDAKAGVPDNFAYASLDNVDNYDDDVTVDQTITVHLKHIVTAVDVPVTRTIHYVGAPNPIADEVQTINWTRSTDMVTNVSSCATSATGYPSVTSPDAAGYLPDVAVVAAAAVTSPAAICPSDSSVTVTYGPQQQVVNVVYVDDDAAGAVVAGAGKTLNGPSGSDVGFTEADAKAGVPTNYLYVSFTNVDTYDLDAAVDQTITVHVVHDHSTADVPVTRTIHYTGSPSPIDDEVQTVNWVRTTDLVANTSTCATTSAGYPSVTSPDVAGYLPDVDVVPAAAVTSPVAVCPASSSVTVTYGPQEQIVNVEYVDDDAAGAVVAGAGKTLTGPSGSDVGFTEDDAKAGVPANYSFVSFSNVDTYDLDVTVDQTITVHVKHIVTFADVPVTRTIHYTGSPSPIDDEVQTVNWVRSTDMVANTSSCATTSTGYPSVTSPDVAGYLPDVDVVPAASVTSPAAVCPADSSVTVTYTPQTQTVNVEYVDDDAAGAVVASAAQTLTGPSGSAVGFTEDDAQAGVPDNYLYVSLDNVTTYDLDVTVDQTITVHISHDHTLTDVPVIRTIHYTGAPSPVADKVQTINWVRTTDKVDATSSCATTSTGYPSVTSPTVAGYLPDVAVIAAAAITSPMAVCPADSSATVTYAPQTQTVNVVYVDNDASGAVVAGAGKTLTGPSGSAVGFTEDDAKAGVPENYVYVSLKNVTTYDLDVTVDQTITVHVKHVVTFADVMVTRTIHYVGSPSPVADKVQSIKWIRATDMVNSRSSCSTSATDYPEVTPPAVAGFVPDLATVPAADVISPAVKCPADSKVTVTYDPQIQVVSVVYVDDDASGAVVAGAGKTLTGPSGGAVDFTRDDARAGVPVNYSFVSFSNVTTYDLDVTVDQVITVHVKHIVAFADVPVTRTVHYVGLANPIADNVQTVTWTRSTDMVTHKSSCATTSTGYPEIKSPEIDGYTVDVALVPALAVTSPMDVCPANITVTVTYKPVVVAAGGSVSEGSGAGLIAAICAVIALGLLDIRRRRSAATRAR